jgi:Holliday junction DNA helicase RuvA
MIAGIEGKLVQLGTENALVQVGAITYEVMLPGYCVSALSGRIGTDIALCTMEYYEGSLGGGNLVPRLVGFLSPVEREFFSTFISVKGLGIRKGLRALSIPIADIAGAVEAGDEKMLMTLSGIGRRMAQQIVAELKGKLEGFAFGAAPARAVQARFKPFQAEALEIFVAWGEKRNEAMELIEQTSQRHPEIRTAEELVPLVYRLKQGAEV